MAEQTLMSTAVRLAASMDALAALAAHVRLETEPIDADPSVREALRAVARELLGDVESIDGPAATAVVGMARAFARQAVDLIDDPGRRGDWAVTDPALLQGLGRLSGAIAGAFRSAEADLSGLGESLSRDGARFLDVGTGTAWLAIATATTYPAAHVVGIDIFDTALNLARGNVAASAVADRVELRSQDVTELSEPSTYDAIWLPLPFLPQSIVPAASRATADALRPGGWLLAGTFAGSGDRMSQLLVDLRTARSGGRSWTSDEIVGTLTDQGLTDAHEVPRTWAAPVRLWGARRA